MDQICVDKSIAAGVELIVKMGWRRSRQIHSSACQKVLEGRKDGKSSMSIPHPDSQLLFFV